MSKISREWEWDRKGFTSWIRRCGRLIRRMREKVKGSRVKREIFGFMGCKRREKIFQKRVLRTGKLFGKLLTNVWIMWKFKHDDGESEWERESTRHVFFFSGTCVSITSPNSKESFNVNSGPYPRVFIPTLNFFTFFQNVRLFPPLPFVCTLVCMFYYENVNIQKTNDRE